MNTVWLLAPDLTLIAIGFALHRSYFRDQAFWPVLEKLTYFVLFPALLFATVSRTPIQAAEAGPTLAAALGAVAAGVVLGYLARPVLKPDERQFASGVQCAFRFNSYVFLALSHRLAGEAGLSLAAVIIGIAVPPINVAAVWPLARNAGSGLAKELARNPLLLATMAGLIANLLGVRLPELAENTLLRLGSASLVLGLLSAGAGLRMGAFAERDPAVRARTLKLAGWFIAVKLAAMPLVALGLSQLLKLPPVPAQIVVAYAALPTAPAAYILASRMGGDGAFVAMLVSATLIASAFALPFWIALV
jgi:predicted permease